MKSKRSPKNPPRPGVSSATPPPENPRPTSPVSPAAPVPIAPAPVSQTSQVPDAIIGQSAEAPPAKAAPAPPSPPAAAPLLSLGAAIEAAHLDLELAPDKAASEVKPKPADVVAFPAAPRTELPPELAKTEVRQAAKVEARAEAETVSAKPPPVTREISENLLVKDLPALTAPDPEPVPAPAADVPAPQPPPTPARRIEPMFVVMLTPELTPVAKVGGLGDVVAGLSRELEMRGNAVEIILPKYDCMRYHHINGLVKAYENLQVPWYHGAVSTTVWFGFVHGRKCFFIEPHSQDRYFNRGVYYGHNDDVMRFAFFCRAAMEFLFKTGKHPDIIHCHDWQTALAPVLLWEMYQHLGMRHPRVCFTIHNFKHQGLTGEHVLRATGLNRPEHFFSYDRMRDNANPAALNLTKAGIVYSNFVTTVSPRHAWEAKDGGQAFGLERTLHIHHQKYGGVLNGLDYDMFNPEKDPYIPAHFNAKTVGQKYENKSALRKRLWLADGAKPIVAFIGRLDPQKGVELVRHAIFYALNHGAQFVLLGESPDKSINDHFWGLKRHLNDNPDCHLEIGYSDELAHLIYAGADLMVVPSHFEPCGLTQLISLRYGTVPVVRSVGGLADTVFDKDHSPLPLHQRNGYVFPDATNASMESTLHRAIGCYYEFPDHFRHLILNGMNCDYSWNHPGQHYLNIYDYIRDK